MTTLVLGARGGIGAALAEATHAEYRWSRPEVDATDEASVMRAVTGVDKPVDLAIVTTGMLHDDRQQPERRLADLDPQSLARSFAINSVAPAIAAKHLIPLLPRDRRAVFAVLGARVGSIADNRTGGWYAYRASKAALAMLVRTIAIEVARTRPQTIVVALHPGTVDTAMSKPFQRAIPAEKLFTPEQSAAHLLKVVAGLSPADSGGHFAWDGSRISE